MFPLSEEHDKPLLEWTGPLPSDEEAGPDPALDVTDPDDVDKLASNDQWAFEKADQLVNRLPKREGKKDQRTEGEVFDRQTLMTLHKMLRDGILRSLDFPVSTGKEANVFRGTTHMGGHVAVKIFRTNTSTFKHVLQYIQGDERFEGVHGDKRTLVNVWAQKEFRNMVRMRDAGMSVPEPIHVSNNVLVMEYIGIEEGPWPRLKDLGRLPDPRRFYNVITEEFVKAVNDAGIVHADISEFNILVEDAGDPTAAFPRIIDVGQGVLRSHPMALEFLHRDVKNLTNYFRRQRLDVTEQDLLKRIDLVSFE